MKELGTYFVFSKKDYDKLADAVTRENADELKLYSVIAFLTMGIMTLVSWVCRGVEYNRVVYGAYCGMALLYMCCAFLKASTPRVQELLIYTFYGVLLSFGIVTGTIVSPQELTVNYIVLMVVVPMLFTTRACIMNSISAASIVVYILMARYTQSDDIFTRNMLLVLPYGSIGCLVNAMIMRSKLQRLAFRQEIGSLEKETESSQKKISSYESFVTDMVRYASSEENPDRIIDQLVEYIGNRLASDRAYIFEENEDGTFDNTYEWCRTGVTREKDNLQQVPFEGVIEVWYQQYRKSNNIVIRDLEDYRSESQAIYDLLKPQGVNTLVTGPIIIEGKMIGFYGVDNPPVDQLVDVSNLIGMMESIISFMIRLRDNARKLEYGSLHDQLTGCKNRKALEWIYALDAPQPMSVAVAMCDLNGLKEINDRQGHDAGDRFIVRTADILRSVFGEENVYRMGGDEFTAVLTGITGEQFEDMVELAAIQLGNTAAVGVVYRDTMDMKFDDLLKLADREMYEQKSRYYSETVNNRRRR